jgi:hypothetical protein
MKRFFNSKICLFLLLLLGYNCKKEDSQLLTASPEKKAQNSLSINCIPPPTSMTAWWTGDGNADDIVGGNNGILHGGVTFPAGEVDQGFEFDGSTGFVEVPQNSLWQFGSADFTVDFWVKFRRLPTAGSLDEQDVFDIIGVDEGPGRTNKWMVRFGAGVVTFHVNDDGSGPGPAFLAQAPFSPNVNEWYLLAFTRNGSTWSTYVNGQLEASEIDSRSIAHINAPLTWGLVEEARYLEGSMDEIEIYNRGLSASEILAIYNAGSNGKCKPGGITTVTIDIKPESFPNHISCKNLKGLIPVAVLTTNTFDAATINVSTVKFGKTGTEASETQGKGRLEDVDGDGDQDMMLHFRFGDTGLDCGDTEAILTGETTDGDPIQGNDSVDLH